MSFEHGTATFRAFAIGVAVEPDAAAKLAEQALPPMRTLGSEPIEGWTGGRHAMDVPIRDDNAWYGGYLRVLLVRAERRLPSSYLKAVIQAEELARMTADGRPYLNRTTRAEIRRSVAERLAPEAPPTLRAIQVAADPAENVAFADALSEAAADRLSVYWHRTFEQKCDVLDPPRAALHLGFADPREWPQADAHAPSLPDPGGEFLTWLWYAIEERGGEFDLPDGSRVGCMLQGPLVLGCDEGGGALEAVIRKGEPVASVESRAALREGKRLLCAGFGLAAGSLEWTGRFDARAFGFRSVALTEDRALSDPVSRFQDRMRNIAALFRIWMSLYRGFLSERTDPRRWRETAAAMQQWRGERP